MRFRRHLKDVLERLIRNRAIKRDADISALVDVCYAIYAYHFRQLVCLDSMTKAKTMQAIRAQGATPIFVSYKQIVGPEGTSAWIANDPHHHFTAAAHTRVAVSVLPRVIAAIGKK